MGNHAFTLSKFVLPDNSFLLRPDFNEVGRTLTFAKTFYLIGRPLKAMRVQVKNTGILFRNAKTHLRSLHAYFPSLALLADGTLLAAFDLGSAFESIDVRTFISCSTDQGTSWSSQESLTQFDSPSPVSTTCRISRTIDGTLIGLGGLFDRSNVEEGLANPKTGGFVPMKLYTIQSRDDGKNWTKPCFIQPPLIGPAFEVCSPILARKNGEWLAPVSTWKGWNGDNPTGMKAILLHSKDGGVTWPDYTVVMDRYQEGIVHWEIKLVELGRYRLMAVCWTHNLKTGQDLPNHYVISEDGGRNFSQPRSTELLGQTCTPLVLENGRILCLYRRRDKPGLWASISRLDEDRWVNESQTPIWGAVDELLHGSSVKSTAVEAMSSLRFGLPAMLKFPDGDIFLAFWCVENYVSNIRWFRLAIGAE